ncbi:MAG: hypothetical protein M0Q90_10020 [Bacteroidales bacterium]|nr:hypothetical protein [Bacteroidales bacterium]
MKAQDTVFLKKKSAFYINDSVYRTKSDTIIILKPGQKFLPLNKDSVFYQTLSNRANRNRILAELLDLAIRQTPASNTVQGDLIDESKKWDEYKGLIISDIIIKQPPIGEFSFIDSALYANKLAEIVQFFHTYTKPEVIRKNLYIKKGDTINPWNLTDNERYIRNLSFIENARFYPTQVSNDSIELLLVVQDKIAYGIFPVFHSANRQSLKIRNSNFLGFGNELGLSVTNEKNTKPEVYISDLHFKISNFNKTFIQAKAAYSRSSSETHLSMEAGREYLANAYQLAGNIELSYNDTDLQDWMTPNSDFVESTAYFDANVWAGYQIELDKKKRLSMRPAYIFPAAAIYNRYHIDRPFINLDSNLFLSNQSSFYASLSLLSQDFISTEKLLAQGLKQTLPVGLGLTFTSGYMFSEFYNMPYLGFSSIYAIRTNRLGYLIANLKFGTFIHKQHMRQGAFEANISHLGRAYETGRYGFRIFTGLRYTLGINRVTYDSLYLNNTHGITGLSTDDFKGFQRINAELEFILYTPWRWIGFYFTPYFIAEAGLIGRPGRSVFKNRFISAFGAGIRLRNEFLVFSSIQLRFLFYPHAPAGDSHWSIDLSDEIDFEYFDFNPGAPGPVKFE